MSSGDTRPSVPAGDTPRPPACALSLPGGGLTGALYQIGALAALEDGVRVEQPGPPSASHADGQPIQRYAAYIGSSSGASVAAALAGGIAVDRLYRALLDPVDNFFPLERGHLLRMDLDEWRRALTTGAVAIRHALVRLATRGEPTNAAPSVLFLWEQIDRLNDSLPAGLFALDRYERLLAQVFVRRGIPNDFRDMPRALRVAAHDLDSGERVVFGAEGRTHIPVSLACTASLALPLFFSPVRIDGRHYLDGGLGSVAHLDVAEALGASLCIVVNPLVPVSTAHRAVPTGHGVRGSVRDKGLLWVFNQSMRVGAHARLHQEVARMRASGMPVLVLEPEPTDALLFLHNPVNFDARRTILEYAYRTTRERIAQWVEKHRPVVERMGWRAA